MKNSSKNFSKTNNMTFGKFHHAEIEKKNLKKVKGGDDGIVIEDVIIL